VEACGRCISPGKVAVRWHDITRQISLDLPPTMFAGDTRTAFRLLKCRSKAGARRLVAAVLFTKDRGSYRFCAITIRGNHTGSILFLFCMKISGGCSIAVIAQHPDVRGSFNQNTLTMFWATDIGVTGTCVLPRSKVGALANEMSLVDCYKVEYQRVLHRPIETTVSR
jgi:hypothetical protein